MKTPLVVVALFAAGTMLSGVPATAATSERAVPVTAAQSAQGVRPIAGHYIVELSAGTDARGLARALSAHPHFVYSTAVNGFAAELTAGQLNALRRNPSVLRIEQDAWVDNAMDATQANPPSWGLDRIDQRDLPLSTNYTYTAAGTGVHAYIIDTGIDVSHPDFGGRATFDYNAIDRRNVDCQGHGTHVAGTVGGTAHGVAKGVRLHAVKMMNCQGSGKNSATLAAIDWVTANAVKPAVANTSWNWTYSATLANAIGSMIGSGVFLATSAGNTGANSCDRLPRAVSTALVVAASTSADQRASFSSTGPCVDLYAPGATITSTQPNNTTATWNGTSMATPHVAGVAALYKSTFGDVSSATLHAWLVDNATAAALTGNLVDTPNLLLYSNGL